jgi:hypothetical protein
MDGTILGQGSFVQPATAINQTIVVPSNLDWLRVINYTQANQSTSAAANGASFYWQRGMPNGTGIVYEAGAAGAVSINVTANNAFVLYDPSQSQLGVAVATTASTNAVRPVVSTGNTAGLAVGSIVRLSNTAQSDVNGIDMVVGAVSTNSSFTLLTASNPLATAPGAIGGAGFYRIVGGNPLFYPRRRFVVNVTQAANAQVSTSVPHGLTPGQEVRFSIPQVSGMIQLNPSPLNNYFPLGSASSAIVVTVVDDYNFTININTSSYNAFTWPTIAQQPSSFPEVVPFGEDTATSLMSPTIQIPTIAGQQIFNTNSGILADSTVNTGFLGMTLSAGALLPAGIAADVVYWVAGKSMFGGL